MSFSTLVLVYHFIGRLYASTSSINHVHYILRLAHRFYICDVVFVKSCTQSRVKDCWTPKKIEMGPFNTIFNIT